MRKPKIESAKSINEYLVKIDQSIENTYAIDSMLFEYLRSTPFKPGWPPSFRPSQLRVYDNLGSPIVHWASCEGYLSDLGTFDTIPPRNQVNLDSTLNLRMDLDRYFTLNGQQAIIEIEEGYDYYIVVYFAKYFHKLNNTTFAAIETFITSHPELKIKVYKINIDVMDWWGVELETDVSVH
ncbi:MAG: hypothetical protein IPH84_02110 [Bacteroidales bacterium]|nr:hypothetical protein [Bacteroidales bacterium]